MNTRFLAATLLLGSLLASGAHAAGNTVEIKNFAFVPATLTVPVGTTVTWTNTDEDPHTVADRGDAHLFRSAALDTNAKYSFIFSKAGSYDYFCTLHPHMIGKIVVTAR